MQRSLKIPSVCFWLLCVLLIRPTDKLDNLMMALALFCVQESVVSRPKEIPHNEKLLSLKYEVKGQLSFPT